MAGIVTYKIEREDVLARNLKITIDWVSDAAGAADGVIYGAVGRIERVVTDPDDTAAPTTLYDVALNDEQGIDVLLGRGANRSATVSESIAPGHPITDGTTTGVVPVAVHGALTLAVTNAGDTKAGKIVLYLAQ